jgi:hypothetical protein
MDNTHLVGWLPESASEGTTVPVGIVGDTVYIDLLNLTRAIAMEAADMDAAEACDADAAYVLDRIAVLASLPADDGWALLGRVIPNPGGDRWLDTESVVVVEALRRLRCPSAAGYRYSTFGLSRPVAVPFGGLAPREDAHLW